MDTKTIGILGGYGNNATIHFQEVLGNKINYNRITWRYYKTIVINDSLLYDKGWIDIIDLISIDEEALLKKK